MKIRQMQFDVVVHISTQLNKDYFGEFNSDKLIVMAARGSYAEQSPTSVSLLAP